MLKRLATMAAVGAFAGLPLATTATAAPGADVTFTSSGVAGLLCDSKPSTSNISVNAETRIRLTNRLGSAATLNIDGSASATVAANETVEVQFHHGPVSITMVQSCLIPPNTQPLTVAVTPAPPPVVQPSPTRPAPAPAVPPAAQPTTTKPAAANPQQSTAAALPPLPGESLFPDPSNLAGAGTAAPLGDTLETPPAVVLGADGTPSKRLASDTPLDKGPIGLLAIIATVCVVGVTAGAIRAIITQRATRVEFA